MMSKEKNRLPIWYVADKWIFDPVKQWKLFSWFLTFSLLGLVLITVMLLLGLPFDFLVGSVMCLFVLTIPYYIYLLKRAKKQYEEDSKDFDQVLKK